MRLVCDDRGMRRLALALAVVATATSCTANRTPDGAATAPPISTRTPAMTTPPLTASPTPVAPLAGPPRLQEIGRFTQPLYVTSPPGDPRLFVVEKVGRVRVVAGGTVRPTPYLDISADVSRGSEQGLLSIAFPPDYASSGKVYVDYTDRDGDTRVVEYTVDPANPDRVTPGSRRQLLQVDQPFSNHNGGLLVFDPSGMLIVGLGDGGSGGDPGNRGQDLGTHLGKLLRIDPRPTGGRPYAVPADNPFVGRAGARPEIWAYGLRNPWRFSFSVDGRLWLADVGQGQVEEINVVAPGAQAGANYGWRAYEGNRRFSQQRIDESRLVRPVLTYGHEGGRCSVTGGGVYRGRVAALRGAYLYGDYCSGEIWALRAPGSTAEKLALDGRTLASFGEDAAGEMYVVDLGGTVSRITAGP